MKRVLLTVAYDGTDFCGFQTQPGLRSVEDALNSALSELTGEQIAVIGASRTDSGVHALANAAAFDTVSTIPADRFSYALNTKLPPDVRIVSSCEVPADWHPRHQNCLKTYTYTVDTGYVPSPLMCRFAMHFPRNLDIEKMREAAEVLLGEHDFTSFTNPKSQVLQAGGSPVRTITGIRVQESSSVPGRQTVSADGWAEDREKEPRSRDFGRIVTIEVTGNGFLYNMVRIIAGTLLDVGTGRFSKEDIKEMLAAKDRTGAGLTAEARGLCLKEIHWL